MGATLNVVHENSHYQVGAVSHAAQTGISGGIGARMSDPTKVSRRLVALVPARTVGWA